MSGMSAGKWRLVDGDDARKGDWYLDDRHNWIELESDPDAGLKYHFVRFEMAVRRRMTPAEEHAEELLATLKELIHDIEALVRCSEGVAGLHKNGDIAPWDDLLDGGRYEGWLPLTKAEAAIAKAGGEQP